MEDIFDYGINRWGEKQAAIYTKKLYHRFEWLVENSKLGIKREEVKEGYKSYFQGKHTIFFREKNHGIEIIGIPKHSEDFIQHLNIEQTQELLTSEIE